MRLAALLLIGAALAPGTWLRSEYANRPSAEVTITPLAAERTAHGGFTVESLWQLEGEALSFGGYSAMGLLSGGTIRLFSDKGWVLTFPRPDGEGGESASSTGMTVRRLYPTGIPLIDLLDIESVTYFRGGHLFWVGYENRHTIYRYDVAGEPEAFLEPEFARNWSSNGGIEAMVRMADGRFVILRELGGEGYIFDGDPVEGAEAMRFPVNFPQNYSPTDMAQLPDGRVLIVLRRVAFANPVFEAMIAIADPAEISADTPWQVTPLVQLEDLVPRENYEAIAVEPRDDGAVSVWLASDDNLSAFQRSLLVKLRFHPDKAAAKDAHEKGRRAEAGAPSS